MTGAALKPDAGHGPGYDPTHETGPLAAGEGRILVTHEDPLARSASAVTGGPAGSHFRQHPWWTPLRVVLALCTVVFGLAMVQKTPCVQTGWHGSDEQRYGAMCYSDLPYLYVPRGLAERWLPYSDNGGRYQDLEYPVLIGYVAFGQAVITQVLVGQADIDGRRAMAVDKVWGAAGVDREMRGFFMVGAIILFGFALAAAYFMTGVHRGRPYDALPYVAAPMVVLTGLINWDFVAIFGVAGALWAWSRGRPLLAGVFIGLGTAAKLYPAFLLGALLVTALRRRDLPRFWPALGGAAGTWLLVNLLPMVGGFEHWKVFWTFNSDRGPDWGSAWLVLQQTTGTTISSGTVNTVSEIAFVLLCVAILVLGLKAPEPPRVAQIAFLIVAAFLLVNKVYSPQYVLWLLPLAVLARPRWRDLLIWQAAEAFYFAAIWWQLGGFNEPAGGGHDRVYWFAVIIRLLAQLWFAALVVRDIWYPDDDFVRIEGPSTDPAYPLPVNGSVSGPGDGSVAGSGGPAVTRQAAADVA